jgi:hypothetical protein
MLINEQEKSSQSEGVCLGEWMGGWKNICFMYSVTELINKLRGAENINLVRFKSEKQIMSRHCRHWKPTFTEKQIRVVLIACKASISRF